jgi:chemotaxis signal transduction protein
MDVSILAFSVGDYIGGLNFGHVEHVEEQRNVSGEVRERSLRVGDEILPLVDLRTWFGVKGPLPAGGRIFVWDVHRRVFVVDEALKVIRLSAGEIHPLPLYIFQRERLFRGLFPYENQWGLLLEENVEHAAYAQVG